MSNRRTTFILASACVTLLSTTSGHALVAWADLSFRGRFADAMPDVRDLEGLTRCPCCTAP